MAIDVGDVRAGSLRDRFRGTLLGTALSDARGTPVEGLPATEIRRRHGRVRDMLPARIRRRWRCGP